MSDTLEISTRPINELRNTYGVFGSDDLFDAEEGGACWSHEEARAKNLAAAKASIEGLDKRQKYWINSWRKKFNDPKSDESLEAAVQEAKSNNRTTTGTVKLCLNLLAEYSSMDGTDPVFPSRETLADRMGVKVPTIGRCLAAAERAGWITKGWQLRWLEEFDDGSTQWKSGAAARMLLIPQPIEDLFAAKRQERGDRKQKRVRARLRAEQKKVLERQRQAQLEQQKRIESLITYPMPQSTPSVGKPLPEGSGRRREAIKAMRQSLE